MSNNLPTVKAQLQERIEAYIPVLSDVEKMIYLNQLAIMQSQKEILERLESVRAACIPMPECVSCNEIKPTFSMCSDCIDERVENEIKNRSQQEGKEPEIDEWLKKIIEDAYDAGDKYTGHDWHMQEFHGGNCCDGVYPPDKETYVKNTLESLRTNI